MYAKKKFAWIMVFLLLVSCQNFKTNNNKEVQDTANNTVEKKVENSNKINQNLQNNVIKDTNSNTNSNSSTNIDSNEDSTDTNNNLSNSNEISLNEIIQDQNAPSNFKETSEENTHTQHNESENSLNIIEEKPKFEEKTELEYDSDIEMSESEDDYVDSSEDSIYEEDVEEDTFIENSNAEETADYAAKVEEERLQQERLKQEQMRAAEEQRLEEKRRMEQQRLADEKRRQEEMQRQQQEAKNKFWNSLKAKAGTYIYDFYVDKTKYGTQTITISLRGQDIIVNNNVNVDASTWYYTYKYKQQDTEIWRNGQLLSYSCFMDDNGTKKQVNVIEGSSGYIVKSSGTSSAKAPLATGVSWNLLEMLEEYPSFSYIDGTKDGQVVVYSKSNLNILGEENIQAAGQNMRCQHLRPSSKEWDVWYNNNKVLVRSTSTNEGSFYDIVLVSIKK